MRKSKKSSLSVQPNNNGISLFPNASSEGVLLSNLALNDTTHHALALAVALSFVYPFFWWTFFDVSTFGPEALWQAGSPSTVLLLGILGFSMLLIAFENQVRQCIVKYPLTVVGVSCISAAATLILFASKESVFDLPVAASNVLALLDSAGICTILFAWGQHLTKANLSPRNYAMAFACSLFLFFGYVLLFIGIPQLRCLLCVGCIASAAVLMLGNIAFFSFDPLTPTGIADNIANVSFICGCVIALCFMAISSRQAIKTGKERNQEQLFDQTCDALAAQFNLSDREREVLRLIARGYGAKGVAESLQVATSTAQTHISRIYTKANVHSRQELILLVEESTRTEARKDA